MAVKTSISWDTIGPFLVWQFLIPVVLHRFPPWPTLTMTNFPPQGASWAQTLLYSIFIRAGEPKPSPGSPRYNKHRRQLLISIYIAYFAFLIYEVDFHVQRAGTAYTALGVPLDVDESGLASRFRKLTVRYHPDKVKGNNVDREKANDYYVYLKHARDIILDPAKRFAYDRFGENVLRQCAQCLTVREYVQYALREVLVTYGALTVFLVGANALGYLTDGAYWRYLAILAVAAYEARTAMRPDFPTFLSNYVNPLLVSTGTRPAYLPFQATAVVRKAALSAAQFLGLLIPLWRDDPQKSGKAADDSEEARHKQIDRLDMLLNDGSQLASRLVDMESTPYRHDPRAKNDLKEAMKRYMMTNAVHMDREVRNAMGQSYARRRAGVPSGAKGTR
jgi:curved DNA-binding protein CbpA